MKRLALILVCAFTFTSCTYEQIAYWAWWDQQPGGCHEAVDVLWPADSQAWAHAMVSRESGGDPTADNPASTASGCAQLLQLHAWRFEATGSSWANRFDPQDNIRAAVHLFKEAGTAPWR